MGASDVVRYEQKNEKETEMEFSIGSFINGAL